MWEAMCLDKPVLMLEAEKRLWKLIWGAAVNRTLCLWGATIATLVEIESMISDTPLGALEWFKQCEAVFSSVLCRPETNCS